MQVDNSPTQNMIVDNIIDYNLVNNKINCGTLPRDKKAIRNNKSTQKLSFQTVLFDRAYCQYHITYVFDCNANKCNV